MEQKSSQSLPEIQESVKSEAMNPTNHSAAIEEMAARLAELLFEQCLQQQQRSKTTGQ